ncbi:MAG TPA: hypothetical protein VF039_04370 [Longimicrobiales bacterium]
MTTSAIVTFAIIASFVWGGIVLIVSTAFRREGAKQRRAAASAAPERTPGS